MESIGEDADAIADKTIITYTVTIICTWSVPGYLCTLIPAGRTGWITMQVSSLLRKIWWEAI